MTWELREVNDVEATLDDSGVYVIINRVKETRTFKDREEDFYKVRADLMSTDHEPIVSFQGSANAVRKHLIRFLRAWGISREHASYIGYELLRAEITDHYVQD